MQMTVWIYVISPNNIFAPMQAKIQANLSEIVLDKWF